MGEGDACVLEYARLVVALAEMDVAAELDAVGLFFEVVELGERAHRRAWELPRVWREAMAEIGRAVVIGQEERV